ncbi:diacylglycerol/lipid kinase family protein [Roseobacter sp. HKCCA0434]|uniref:diacylglycerol/lipid kinase family protein n=1 Tax=Roseobacter sp. HKCCA0434 TaxID=3079297 RepID=UPI002905CD07|nr:diacylglycerol kinase family protein [Roseobacter sp. HKCCA0434]
MTPSDTSPSPARYVVVYNGGSGKDDENPSADEVRAAFEAQGAQVEILTVSGGDGMADTIEQAVGREGVTCVVAAGGDGTISAVAGALAGRDIALGVLPLGTFNYFARRLDIPEELEDAVATICGDGTCSLNVGCVNGRAFINNASIGLYPTILKVREGIYDRWGRSRLAAYWSVLVAMATAYRHIPMRIEVDGTERRARSSTVFVAISAYQLDEFDLEGADAVRAGKFALYLAPDCGRFALAWKAIKVAFRGVRSGQDYSLRTGERAVVSMDKDRQLVAVDGEREEMQAPFEFTILQDALTVKVPQTSNETGEAA